MEIWNAEVRPTGNPQGLLLSVVFCSEPGGFVRVIWKSPVESVTLAADLTEGNLWRHQRSLFLDASRLTQLGQIWIEAKGASLQKVRLERLDGVGWGSARRGDSHALALWKESVRGLAVGINSLINVLDPQAVILGGGIAQAGPLLFDLLAKTLARHEWRPMGSRVRILPAQLGELAGAYGASYQAIRRGVTANATMAG